MVEADPDEPFCHFLRSLNERHGNRYTAEARSELLKALFGALVGYDNDWLGVLFGRDHPILDNQWDLSAAQGSFEGSEYSEQARGKRCGHIFKSGEASYRCKTCSTDETCVLCSKCFAATEHSGHQVFISISPGNSGCCDCGDEEAWNVPLSCAIHTSHNQSGKSRAKEKLLPEELESSIRITIARAFDFLCDIISCSPEQMRLPKTEEGLKQNESESRLNSTWYADDDPEINPEYCLILWNDEKHSVGDVTNQVARACKETSAFGKSKARETDDVGRSILMIDRDLKKLMNAAMVIEKIKITVTVRTARDTFREQMCGTIIEWLLDICGCRVGPDGDILKNTVCEEMLQPWRVGSNATNAKIGRDGIFDHEITEVLEERAYLNHRRIHDIQIQPNGVVAVTLVGGETPAEDQDDAQDTHNGAEVDAMDEDAVFMQDDEDIQDVPDAEDSMDLDALLERDPDDPVETDEATLAGYPPPPPPPPVPRATRLANVVRTGEKTSPDIPKTPQPYTVSAPPKQRPTYWVDRFNRLSTTDLTRAEDVRQRVRLDYLMLWDLRMWKKARIDLRSVYIQTLVTVPQFKRILGLRFSGLYPLLAQVYLIADREPDHSIIYLSLQVITTPSVTKEVIEKGNFMTNLFAVLFTFLTTRQVGHPWEVNPAATLAFETGSVTNRRMYHFFMDIKHLFAADFTQEMLRKDDRYVLQFLDLIRLGQGICPNVRAVGEHVEYETDTWISASLFTREINRLCRLFSEAFRWDDGANHEAICRVLKIFARAAILNAMGADRKPRDTAATTEVFSETKYKTMTHYDYFVEETESSSNGEQYHIVDFTVETGAISFHHALQYMLSWIIECGKSMPAAEVRSLLSFSSAALKAPRGRLADHAAERYLLAMFDFPLRVCSWLAQMKAQMWVRNGLSLRHQMNTYRGVSQRDLAYQRDVFNLQTAVVICNPGRVLLSMVDRFGLIDWMVGNFVIRPGFEDTQMVDVAEEFVHLLLVILTERTSLVSIEEDPSPHLTIRRDIIHNLCFKALSFSDLTNRLADKYQELDEFQDVLDEMTTFKPPKGLNDTGMFELKMHYLSELDPYIIHYSKNQREEAEMIYKKWFSKTTGKPVEDVVVEPKLRPIKLGLFQELGAFTRTHIFAQIVLNSIKYCLQARNATPNVLSTRIETLLQVILHLVLAAIQDDLIDEDDNADSFVSRIVFHNDSHSNSVLVYLHEILTREDLKACHPKVRVVLSRVQRRRPQGVAHISAQRGFAQEYLGTDSPLSGAASDVEAKKKAALERQKRVMAQFEKQRQDFISQNEFDWGDDDLEDDSMDMPAEPSKKVWNFPSGNCILCQEQTNDTQLYGTFGMLIESRMMRQTDIDDPRYLDEVIDLPDSLDRSAEHVRPYGIAGQNHVVIKKTNPDGTETDLPRTILSDGWKKEFSRVGTMSTGCGHVMHWKCFTTYCQATTGRHAHQIARNHPEKIKYNEFVCPLCKALGNAFYPIFWKGKEESYPSVLGSETSLSDFLEYEFTPNLSVHMAETELSNKMSYLTNISRVGSLVDNLDPVSPIKEPLMRMPGEFPRAERLDPLLDDLTATYERIRMSMTLNLLPSNFAEWRANDGSQHPPYTDVLPTTLGYSISALEIAQRGIESDRGATLLDKIRTNILEHLRIVSETASSYIAIAALLPNATSTSTLFKDEIKATRDRQLRQLFWAMPDVAVHVEQVDGERVALMEDPFVLLTEIAVCLASALHINVHHIMELCYILELVKVVIGVQCSKISAKYFADAKHVNQIAEQATEDDLKHFRQFLSFVEVFSQVPFRPSSTSNAYLRNLYGFVANYGLSYLRKCIILMHVRYNVDFPRSSLADADAPELVRLTKLLKLPTLPQLFSLFGPRAVGDGTRTPPSLLQQVVSNWISQWHHFAIRNESIVLKETRLCHPGIFELIGLPEFYDTLLDHMMRQRCPNTKREMVEPALCLFCGEIFCSQGVCCTIDNKGGCNQHIRICGGNTGIFLNLRKCCIIYLHNGNGSFTPAPYLDKHGESDFGLRRNRQLILNQNRYDALVRKNWLEHQIPTTISRKLEGDINNGGWETL